MRSRRLLSSLGGSLVVAALMGCNAIVGNEDITYTDPADPGEKDPPPENVPVGGNDTGTDPVDTGTDVKDARDEDQISSDSQAVDGGGGASDGSNQG